MTLIDMEDILVDYINALTEQNDMIAYLFYKHCIINPEAYKNNIDYWISYEEFLLEEFRYDLLK